MSICYPIFKLIQTRIYKKFNFIIFFILFNSFSYAYANSLCPKALRIGFDIYPPFQMTKVTGEATGIDIELIRKAAKELGCQIDFFQSPWKRQMEEFKKGDLDILSSSDKTPQRELIANFYTPYLKGLNAFFIRSESKGKYSFHDLTDVVNLPNFKLGVVRGYEYGGQYEYLLKNNKKFAQHLVIFPNETKIIAHFTSSHPDIDAILGDLIVIPYLAKLQKKDHLISIYSAKVNDESLLYYMYNKSTISEELGKKLNQKIELLIANGYLEKLVLTYLPQKYFKLISTTP